MNLSWLDSTTDFFYDSIAVNFYMNADSGLRAAADDYGYGKCHLVYTPIVVF